MRLKKVNYNWDIPTLKKMAQRIKREEDRIEKEEKQQKNDNNLNNYE